MKRPRVDDDGTWHFFDGALQTWRVKEDSRSFTSGQRFRGGSDPHTGVGRKSTATPPYHIHLFQTETFDVKEGTLCYLIDGKEGKMQPGQKVDIPPYRPHTVSREEKASVCLMLSD
jgi:quercetin dioxygenase-like cupin family protein